MAVDRPATIDEAYQRARRRVRWRPAWWLRRREAQIIATRPRPTDAEQGELRAISRELRIRSGGPWLA